MGTLVASNKQASSKKSHIDAGLYADCAGSSICCGGRCWNEDAEKVAAASGATKAVAELQQLHKAYLTAFTCA